MIKKTIVLINVLFFIGWLLPLYTVSAEDAGNLRQQLKQMVAELQKNPADNALREKIIRLAVTIRPMPAVPEEAERRMVRGTAAFKGAKSVADYQDAVKEFELATLVAPWYGDAYYNLGVAQDKAEQYEAALRSLKLALLATPDIKEIRNLIYEVEYRNDKAKSPEARAAKERAGDEALVRSLNGARYSFTQNHAAGSTTTVFEIRDNEVIRGGIWAYDREMARLNGKASDTRRDIAHYPLKGRAFKMGSDISEKWACSEGCPSTCDPPERTSSGRLLSVCPMFGIISEDGSKIELSGNGAITIFRRER